MTHTDRARPDPEIDALLAPFDHAPPDVHAEDIIERATHETPGRRDAGVWRAAPWMPRRAAAVLLVSAAAAGLAYAIPGSPLRVWLDAARASDTATDPQPTVQSAQPDAAGIAIDVGEPLVIELTGTTRGATLHILIDDGAQFSARTPAGGAQFRSEPGRLTIELLSPDTVHVRVPVRAARIDIVAGGRTLFRSRSGIVRTATAREASGAWLVPLD